MNCCVNDKKVYDDKQVGSSGQDLQKHRSALLGGVKTGFVKLIPFIFRRQQIEEHKH